MFTMPRPRLLHAFLALLVLPLMLIASLGSSASAHNGEDVTPADGELLAGTPPEIRLQLPGSDAVTIELQRADGTVVPLTGSVQRREGVVIAVPPVLEPGTYVVRWSREGTTDSSSFSVGEPNATFTRGSLPAREPFAVALSVLAFVAAILTGAMLRRRVLRSIAIVAFVSIAALMLITGRGLLDVLAGICLLVGLGGAVFLSISLIQAARLHTSRLQVRQRWPYLTAAMVSMLLVPATALARRTDTALTSLPTLVAYLSLVLMVMVFAPIIATWLSSDKERSASNRRPLAALSVVLLAVSLAQVALGAGNPERVIALEETTADPAACLTGTNRLTIQRCLGASLVAVVKQDGVSAALKDLQGLLTTNSRARFFCHDASHAIGRASLQANGTLADAFRDGFDVCDFGYYHGIVEGAAGAFDDAKFLATVPTLCVDFASAEELFYMQCNHGIGHAAARRTNNDMVRALEFCDALEKNTSLTGERLATARNGCGTGVTMEWFATATADPNAAVRPQVAEPRDVCTQIPTNWAAECVEYVGNTLDSSDPVNSLLEIGRWCATTGFDESCFRGIARAAAGVGIPARDAIAVCDSGTTTRDDCVSFYIAIVATTIDYDVSAVDRICAALPDKDRAGSFSLCARTREAVLQVLAAGDGK
jgi:methionine-rich copper-binding protein CopC